MWQVWEYETPTGEVVRGIPAGTSDFGGTDVSQRFHRIGPDGRRVEYANGGVCLDIVSGSKLRAARRIGAMPPHGIFTD